MSRFRLRYQSTHLELPLGEFSIGRSSKCSLSLADELVSRRHALLLVEPTAVFIEDLGSRNGVVVNGRAIDRRCRLTHMDRIYIGPQELVLIDAAKMTDQQETGPHVICGACGGVNGASRRFCGECGKRLASAASDTYKEPRRPARGPSWDDPEETGTAKARDVMGGIASKAISMGRYEEAERILLPFMDTLLGRAMHQTSHGPSDDHDIDTVFDTAIGNALDLARGLGEPKWIDWVFRMHVATGRLMGAETIETLHRVVRDQGYHRPRFIRAYLELIRRNGSDYDAPERFRVSRLHGLAEVIEARR